MGKMLCPVAMQAKINPAALAVEMQSSSLSYRELDQVLSQAVSHLLSLGIKKDTRVSFIAPTSFKTIILLLALLRMGAIACPINPKFPQSQIDALLNTLKPFCFIDPDTLIFPNRSSLINPMIDTEQVFTFLATSGSSGKSKIACHTFGNYLTSAQATYLMLKLSNSSRWLLSLPLYHVSGLSILTRCITIGACIVLTESKAIWEEIIPRKITHLSCVPTQLFRLKEQKCTLDLLCKQLQCVLVGGAHTSLEVFNSVKELPIFFTYGMTETTSMITLATKELLQSEMHMGKPISCCEIKLHNNEIMVKGGNLFKGYWDGKRIQSPSVWFATKDLGKIVNANLHLTGRKDRLFISGGENIQPEEIERALCSIKGIISASVLPIMDKEFGSRPVAFVEDIEQRAFEQISLHLRKILPSFKCPLATWPYPIHLKHYTKPPILLLKQHLDSLYAKDAALEKIAVLKEEK